MSDSYAGVSSDAVRAKTGKTWEEWFAILDVAGAAQMRHPEIAAYLAEHQGVPDRWSQMVTVGYEQARGLRQVHEKTDGFTANASKTVAVPVDRLFAAWADEDVRRRWLPDVSMIIRKATPGKSLRVTWADGSHVDVEFTSKGEAKSRVAVQQSRLPDAEASAATKAYWSAALTRLDDVLIP